MRGYRVLLNISKLTDCAGLSVSGRCTKLNISNCQGEKCTFKQTREEEIDSLRNAYQRLAGLKMDVQYYIANRYYGGQMPWNNVQSVLEAE